MADAWPLPAFSFAVSLHGLPSGPDAGFAEISGLETERDVVEIREGGENRYTHRLPGIARPRDLVLKRGIIPALSPLRLWVTQSLESDLATPVRPLDLDVMLLSEKRLPVMTWSVFRAWPLRATAGPFDAQENDVVVETLVLSFARLRSEPVRDAISQLI